MQSAFDIHTKYAVVSSGQTVLESQQHYISSVNVLQQALYTE